MAITKIGEITERAAELLRVPNAVRPVCESFCSFLLVRKTELRREWRCEKCLRYIDAPVSPTHELQSKQMLLTSVAVAGDPPESKPVQSPERPRDLFSDL